jgi:hypothetical protein
LFWFIFIFVIGISTARFTGYIKSVESALTLSQTPMNAPIRPYSLARALLALSALAAFGSTVNAQTVGPIDFSTIAASAATFNSTYNFTPAGGSSTITSNGTYAFSSGGSQSLLFDTTPASSYSVINTFGDGTQAVTVSARVSTAGVSNSFGVHFSNPATLTGSGQTTGAKDLLGLFTMASGSNSVGSFRFYKDNQPGASGWINTTGQITNFVTTPVAGTASISGSGGTFGSTGTPTASVANGYYGANNSTVVSASGAEVFYDISFTYDPTAGSLTGTFGSISATYTIATADLLGVAPSIGITTRTSTTGTATRFDDLTISAIPEPSTYAALAGLATLGFVAFRRRRSV